MTMSLHFHIGPVGRFITESRRTRDYWVGSFLLSRLCGEAMFVVEQNSGKVVRPVTADKDSRFADPTLCAIRDSREGKSVEQGPFLGTLPNRFTAEFNRRGDATNAGNNAEKAVQTLWINLATEIRTRVLDNFEFLTDEALRDEVLSRWDAQIGKLTPEKAVHSPLWEIYWVATPNGRSTATGWDSLDLRKASRVAATEFAGPDRRGNFCTMITGLCDVSGLQRRQSDRTVLDFWHAVRQHLVNLRYPGRGFSADTCLDLRPNERLSAPALVKRLFPVAIELCPDCIRNCIGWLPSVRPAFGKWVSRNLLDQLFERLRQYEPAEAKATEGGFAPDVLLQRALYWPSTSYIAAANWIARTQRQVPLLCENFRKAIEAIGPDYAQAERTLHLRCVTEGFEKSPLAWIDGALLHESRLELVGRDLRNEPRAVPDGKLKAAVAALRALQDVGVEHVTTGGSEKVKNGSPPKHYAIIRADVDHVGELLSASEGQWSKSISMVLGQFSQRLRGNETAKEPDDQYGVVAARNGVLLYCGADEAMIFAPPEDAVGIAVEIHQAFEKCKGDQLPKMTISASILLVDIRAPMRWAIQESEKLLHTTAKEHAGRDALALAVFDIDGLRSPWAAPWNGANGTSPVAALQQLIELASTQHPSLWSNGFYHRLSERLNAFLVPERCKTFKEVIVHCARLAEGAATIEDKDMVEALIKRAVAEQFPTDAAEARQRIADYMVQLTRCCFRDEDGRARVEKSSVVLAPMDFLRVLGSRWCKDMSSATEPVS